MKKSLSILCVVALLIGLMIPVSATTDVEFKLATTNTTVQSGATFNVTVELSGNTGIGGGAVVVTYPSELKMNSCTAQMSAVVVSKLYTSPYKIPFMVQDTFEDNGTMVTMNFTAPEDSGTYTLGLAAHDTDAPYDNDFNDVPASYTGIEITVEGSSEHTAKWNVTGGKVYASATEWTDGDVTLTDGTTGITTTGDVYFYFFPDAGYTTTGMTIDGEAVISDGTVASKKYTLTADKVFDIVFATASGTPTVSTPTVQATEYGATIFGQATNASSFGAYINNAQFAADGADGDGYFAIELSSKDGSKIFNAAKTYTAKLYADSVESAEVSVGITQ